jgi:hypothetical protein
LLCRLWIGAILALDAFTATMGSSIFSPAIIPVSRQYHVADVVGTLGISLFVFGYAFGPLVSAMFLCHSKCPFLVLEAPIGRFALGTYSKFHERPSQHVAMKRYGRSLLDQNQPHPLPYTGNEDNVERGRWRAILKVYYNAT